MLNNLLAGGAVPGAGSASITNPIFSATGITDGVSFFSVFIPALITLALVIGSVIFIFILIMGAIQWISAGDDKQNLEAARSKVTNAVVGIIVLFSAWAIIGFIEYFFCVNITLFEPQVLVVQSGSVGGTTGCPAMPGGGATGVPNNGGVGNGGNGNGGGTGNALCGGCLGGGCGKTNVTYIGPPNATYSNPCYRCTQTGWQNLNTDCSGLGAVACGTCP